MARHDKEEMTAQERREYRKNRRVRNQVIAYMVLILLVLGIGIGGFYGVKIIAGKIKTLVSEGASVPSTSDDSVSQDQFVMDGEGAGVIATPEEFVEPDVETAPVEVECAEARAYIDAMSLDDKVAAMFMVSPEDITDVDVVTQAGEAFKGAIDEYGVGGIVFAPGNANGVDQFTELATNAQLFYQTTYNNTTWIAYTGDNASDYPNAGINVTITPADQFSLGSSGVLDVVTAFPFQDGERVGTFEESMDDLRANRFQSFTTAINSGADGIIVSDTVLSSATGEDMPACMSYAVCTDVLRNELGFEGVIIAGFMDESAVNDNYDAADAAIKAVNAGADMIMCSGDFYAAYDAVLTAVQSGEISESRIDESLMRIYTAKYQ